MTEHTDNGTPANKRREPNVRGAEHSSDEEERASTVDEREKRDPIRNLIDEPPGMWENADFTGGATDDERDDMEHMHVTEDLESQIYLNALATMLSISLRRDIDPATLDHSTESQLGCIVCLGPIGDLRHGVYIGPGELNENVNYEDLVYPLVTFAALARMLSDMTAHVVDEHTDGFDTQARIMITLRNALTRANRN